MTKPELAAALPATAREVEEFVAAAGWDQPPQLFALVPTAELAAAEPGMAGRLDQSAPLTPVAQEPLPAGDLDVALAGILWPPAVAGCAVVQEIVVLPAHAEPAHAEHPDRREARLVAAVLRDGPGACVLRLRAGEDGVEELVEHPDLAPNLLEALRGTFVP